MMSVAVTTSVPLEVGERRDAELLELVAHEAVDVVPGMRAAVPEQAEALADAREAGPVGHLRGSRGGP